MKHFRKITPLIVTVFLAAFQLGCGADPQAEANRMVAESNKTLREAEELMTKTESRNKMLFAADIQTSEQLKAYKVKMNAEAKEIVANYEKVGEMLQEIAKVYDKASDMNISALHKDYTRLKAGEFAKRAEAVAIRKGNAQAFVEFDSADAMNGRFQENNSRSTVLFGEADTMSEKAERMEKDNPVLFTQAKQL